MRPMPRRPLRRLSLTFAVTAAGCPLTPEIIGETITTVDTQGASTTDPGVTTGATDTAGVPDGAYGASCQLLGSPPVLNHAAVSPQPACDGGVCLTIIPETCGTDLDCEANVGEGSVCDKDGICTVTPALVAKFSRCTQTCETVDDCPEIPGCTTGASCGVVVVSDELCCQKVCLCDDYAYLPGIMSLQDLCDEEPNLCA